MESPQARIPAGPSALVLAAVAKLCQQENVDRTCQHVAQDDSQRLSSTTGGGKASVVKYPTCCCIWQYFSCHMPQAMSCAFCLAQMSAATCMLRAQVCVHVWTVAKSDTGQIATHTARMYRTEARPLATMLQTPGPPSACTCAQMICSRMPEAVLLKSSLPGAHTKARSAL